MEEVKVAIVGEGDSFVTAGEGEDLVVVEGEGNFVAAEEGSCFVLAEEDSCFVVAEGDSCFVVAEEDSSFAGTGCFQGMALDCMLPWICLGVAQPGFPELHQCKRPGILVLPASTALSERPNPPWGSSLPSCLLTFERRALVQKYELGAWGEVLCHPQSRWLNCHTLLPCVVEEVLQVLTRCQRSCDQIL